MKVYLNIALDTVLAWVLVQVVAYACYADQSADWVAKAVATNVVFMTINWCLRPLLAKRSEEVGS